MTEAAVADDAANTGEDGAEAAAEAAETAAEAAKGADGGKAADEAAKAATSGDGGEAEGGTVIWPEKWRELMSGGDDKVAEELGRYAEPGLIGPALSEAKKLARAKEANAPLAEDATEKQVAAWRKKNGIPDEAAGYFDKLPEGLEVAEEDRQGMETLTEAMHAINAPSDVVHAAMGAYYKHVKDVVAGQAEKDVAGKKAADDVLNELYGSDFRRNINDLGAWLDTAGDGVKANILGSRMPDGTALGNDPEFLKFMVGQMRQISPLVTVPGLGGGEPEAAIHDEIASIEKVIQNDNAAYRGDKALQNRYLELISARDSRK